MSCSPEYCQFCPRRTASLPGLSGACSFGGDDNAPVLVIGKAPGEQEMDNEPFVGPSGGLLWSVGRQVGLHRTDCRILNVSRCAPAGGKGKTLSPAQIGACSTEFNEAVQNSKAKVVILLGGDALRRVTGLHGIDDYRGYLLKAEHLRGQELTLPVPREYKTSRKAPDGTWLYRKGDMKLAREKVLVEPLLPPTCEWVIATYHPSDVMRAGRKNLRAFVNDLHRAVRALRGGLEVKTYRYTDTPRIVVDDTNDDLLAFDIENHMGLHGHIERIGIAGSKGIWTSDWNGEAKEAARYALADENRIKVAHNIQHDVRHLEAEGVPVPGLIYDTMWGGMVLEPDLPMGLRSMAPLWLDLAGCWKDEARNNPAWYNAHDAGIERDLALRQIARHKEIGSFTPLMKWIMPAQRVLLDMHRRGMKVDLAWLGSFSERLRNRQRRVEKAWSDNTGYQSGMLSSPIEVAGLLYDTFGLNVVRDPDNENKPTTAAWALRLLQQQYPQYKNMLRCLLAYRKIERLLAACTVALGPDGCVHPHFGPQWKDQQDEGGDGSRAKRKGTTSTLRLAVGADAGLNMQQVPEFARRMYVAPEGYVFLKADLDRAEPWVYAVRSGDQNLIRELTHGDPYMNLARKAGTPRDQAKILFLARTYGAGPRKGKVILAKAGIMAEERNIKRIFDVMASEYDRLERYRAGIMQVATKSGRLYSGFGFMREFLGGDRDATEAADWEAQHHVGVILWTLFVPLYELARSLGGWLQMTVYDEVLLCVPIGTEKKAAEGMLEIMRTERPEIAPGFRPAVSEVLVGTNWRDMKCLT